MSPLIGAPLRRLEDPRLVTGSGRYASDVRPAATATLAFVRSPLPAAVVRSLDLRQVRSAPGVLAAWSAEDLAEVQQALGDRAPRTIEGRARPLLAGPRVRYVGQPLAAVVCEDGYGVADALDLVQPDLEPLPAVGTLEEAAAAGASLVHEDMTSNVAGSVVQEFGDVETAFAGDSVVAGARLRMPRVYGGYIEPRAATADYEPETGRLTLWCSTQWTFGVRERVASMLGMEKERVEVRAEDVGGGFGPKGDVYAEELITAFAARRLGRRVRWVASRSEDIASTNHAHGVVLDLELAISPDGELRGLRGVITSNAGAFSSSGAGLAYLMTSHMVCAYHLPSFRVETRVVYTNGVPTGFVRGGGRPVGNFAIERMLDLAAERLGMDRAEIRRRNLIRPEEMPYDTRFPAGRRTVVYDTGDYPRLLDAVLGEVRGEQAGPGGDGRLRGVGVVMCVESSGEGRDEPARVRLDREGTATLFLGSTPQGQGHRTMAAQVLADRLGWPLERIRVVTGDTSILPGGGMTAGSTAAVLVGNAAALAGAAARRKLLERAAEVLEASTADLYVEDGVVKVRGVPSRSLPVADAIPAEGLEVLESFTPPVRVTYPSSCHAAVVAVDPDTGAVELLRYVIAHDIGRALNPMLVEGQLQGGWAHGMGYALFEETVYTPEGQLTTGTFLDYTIAGPPELGIAPELLGFDRPTDANPEGVKGVGESATIPVPAAIAAAVEDAVRTVRPGARVTEIPITADRVLHLLQGGPETRR